MKGRKQRTKAVALCGVLAALTMVGLTAASMLPNLMLGLTAISGLCAAVAVCAAGLPSGFACYGVSAVLALLLLPDKACAIFYALLFGIYPVIKAPVEHLRNLKAEWLLKLLIGNALMGASYALAVRLCGFQLTAMQDKALSVAWAFLNAVFIAYDIACTRILTAVQVRLLPVLRQSNLI